MKKLSNKILLIGLLVLVAIFAASRFFRSPGLESNLRKELLRLDTATISEIRVTPAKERAEELKLMREGNSWRVRKGDRTEATNHTTIKAMLGSLVNLQAQRMASRKKDRWQDYQVGENSTHVSVYQRGSKVADFHVGKLGFIQSNGGGFGGAYTYVRLSDEDEVYTVEGFLESSFNNSFNDFRDKTFLKLDKNEITKISFRYPADSSFVVENRDSTWFVGNEKADPAKVESLLNQFSSKYLTEFVEGFIVSSPADVNIQVEGKTGTLATVEGWKRDAQEWTLTSSKQKGVYFSSKGSTVVADVFKGKKKLLQ
jgi:hypothetical protein